MIPICSRCKKPKGFVEGSWICFTPWWECGIHQFTIEEREVAKKKYIKEIMEKIIWKREMEGEVK